jgi:hypothetical protein
MDWQQKFDGLAAQARAERTPRVDVAQNVLRTLMAEEAGPLTTAERLWMWLAAVSTAIAVPAGVIAFFVYTKSVDPLNEIAEAISWAVQ